MTAEISPVPHRTIIEAGKSERHYWRDIWVYRELFYFLAWRDILVRYKQTTVGIAWAVLQPLFMLSILTAVRVILAPGHGNGPPITLVILAGLIPWQFFSLALIGSSNSLIANQNMLTKVYFPRLLIPTSAIAVALVDFLIAVVILAGIMTYYHYPISWRLVFLPVLAGIVVCASLGGGLWFSALNVKYRDFRYVVPVLVQFGLYASPVIYETSMIPERFRLIYSLNPMVGVIDGFRWAILGSHADVYVPGFVLSLCMLALLIGSGVWYFRRMERTFADVV